MNGLLFFSCIMCWLVCVCFSISVWMLFCVVWWWFVFLVILMCLVLWWVSVSILVFIRWLCRIMFVLFMVCSVCRVSRFGLFGLVLISIMLLCEVGLVEVSRCLVLVCVVVSWLWCTRFVIDLVNNVLQNCCFVVGLGWCRWMCLCSVEVSVVSVLSEWFSSVFSCLWSRCVNIGVLLLLEMVMVIGVWLIIVGMWKLQCVVLFIMLQNS